MCFLDFQVSILRSVSGAIRGTRDNVNDENVLGRRVIT